MKFLSYLNSSFTLKRLVMLASFLIVLFLVTHYFLDDMIKYLPAIFTFLLGFSALFTGGGTASPNDLSFVLGTFARLGILFFVFFCVMGFLMIMKITISKTLKRIVNASFWLTHVILLGSYIPLVGSGVLVYAFWGFLFGSSIYCLNVKVFNER